MKVRQRILVDLCLFLTCFVAASIILYKGVYTQEGASSTGGLVLISEVKPTGGVGKSNDEFVELYNPQTQPVIIGGWSINRMTKNASSADLQQLFVFPIGLVIPSQAHVLVAHAESFVSTSADYLYIGQALSDDNTVVLLNEGGTIVDLVGYGLAKNTETESADAPSSQLLSIERKPGGSFGNGQDTNHNKLDWFRTQPSPQNLHSPLVPESVVFIQTVPTTTKQMADFESIEDIVQVTSTLETITSILVVTSTGASSTTSSVLDPVTQDIVQNSTTTQSHYLMGSILITELYPMPKSGENEFVELFNRTPQAIILTDWYIIDGSGAKTFVSGTLASSQYLVIEKPKGSLNNSGDLISLIAPNETVIDTVSYGEWDDGTPGNNAPGGQVGASVIRMYDTEDSNLNYYDFGISITVTKGAKNIFTPMPPPQEDEDEENKTSSSISGISTSSTRVVVKKPEPLYPRIIYQTTTTVGAEIVFDASLSSGGEGIKQYLWEMDDGTILRGEIVKHVYQLPDTYSVILTVFDVTGAEKHKTVKITVGSNPSLKIEKKVEQVKEKEVFVATAKKIEPAPVFTQMGGLAKTKTNALIRVRGIMAAVFITKTGTEFYFIGESAAGGAAVGVLVKTKNNSIDARVGDIVEITGKYIVNTTSGNYIQYGADDQLSIISSGEITTPFSNTIKNITQLNGGYVQISGELAEKKTSYLILSDASGEIKLTGDIGESVRLKDQLIVIGYVVRTKEGAILRIAGSSDLIIKEKSVTSTAPEITETLNKPERPVTTFVLIGLIGSVLLGFLIKKFWIHKKTMIEATEI